MRLRKHIALRVLILLLISFPAHAAPKFSIELDAALVSDELLTVWFDRSGKTSSSLAFSLHWGIQLISQKSLSKGTTGLRFAPSLIQTAGNYTIRVDTGYLSEEVISASRKFTVTAQSANSGVSMNVMAAEVVRQTNGDRVKYGLPALKEDPELTRAALVRAQEIVKTFSHTRPDGSRGITASSIARAENIAKGQQTADKVMAAWMSSSGHRATILRTTISKIGVCAYRVNGIMYWVQLFG